jgi:hypothetical protein
MVSKSVAVRQGRALALPMAKAAAAGAALMTATFGDHDARALIDSQRLRELSERHVFGDIDATKRVHREWLAELCAADSAYSSLYGIAHPRASLTATEAGAMLSYLFTVMGKRKTEEAAVKLHACVDLFNPASNDIAQALGLWKPVPTHPLVLALAIKKLLAEKIFEPSESELREALTAVEQKLRAQRRWVGIWLDQFDDADAMVFAQDRAAWDAAYAGFGSDVAGAMATRLEYRKDKGRQDINGNPTALRYEAINEIWERKFEAEEAAAALEQQAASNVVEIAACARPSPKRTRKPKEAQSREA